jgi:hypothetical protein
MHRAQCMAIRENHENLINSHPGVDLSLLWCWCVGTASRRICCMVLEMNLYDITVAENYACMKE